MTNDFDIDKTRHDLIALRTKHGANTPIGHRYSNLIEQLENLEREPILYVKVQLQKSIGRSLSELAALSQGERG